MNEFEKKYYESSQFWEGEMLHDQKNLERFRITNDLIKDDVSSILDAGCGNGAFVNDLLNKRNDLHIHALDRSEKALEFVKTKKSLGDVSSLPFDDQSFDCVSCLEVIEHLPIAAYKKTLDELARVAKKYLIISVPYNETIEDSYTKCPSCKSIFNYEFHLRSFDEENFAGLFKERGFLNIKTIKAGYSAHYKFHNAYRRMFYPEQFLKWNSPICPLCGYEEEPKIEQEIIINHSPKRKRKLISYVSAIPKMMWPKEEKPYWIIGLFERI